jgi:hypothetical protein
MQANWNFSAALKCARARAPALQRVQLALIFGVKPHRFAHLGADTAVAAASAFDQRRIFALRNYEYGAAHLVLRRARTEHIGKTLRATRALGATTK